MTQEAWITRLRRLNKKLKFIDVNQIYDEHGIPENATSDILVEFAIALRETGRFFECDKLAERALSLNPNNPRAIEIWEVFERDGRRFNNMVESTSSSRYLTSNYKFGVKCFDEGNFKLCINYLKLTNKIAPDFSDVYPVLGRAYLKNGDIKKAIKTFWSGIEYSQALDLYVGLSEAYQQKRAYDDAIQIVKKAMVLHRKTESVYIHLGILYQKKRDFKEAHRWFNRAVTVNKKSSSGYFYRAMCFLSEKQYDDALQAVKKSVELFKIQYEADMSPINMSNLASGYSLLGNIQRALGVPDKAADAYTNAIRYDSTQPAFYYNRGLVYGDLSNNLSDEESGRYLYLAKEDFTTAWMDNVESDTYFGVLVDVHFEEFSKYHQNPRLFKIAKLVAKLRRLLASDGGTVTHFTSLTVGKELIINNSPLRLSEGTFLNDTSEGSELSRFLRLPITNDDPFARVIDRKFVPKWFIGSFVQESGTNDLTLWRMYGKDGMEEGRGCSITVDSNKLVNLLNDLFQADNAEPFKNTRLGEFGSSFDQEFVFFRVAYSGVNDGSFVVPGFSDAQNSELCSLMASLKAAANEYFERYHGKPEKTYDLESLLGQIKYLFKTDDYRHEQEVRIIIRGGAFSKQVDFNFKPPRVYISTFPINACISKITLGPKVERSDEWASAFYYHLDKFGLNPDIFISSLPFK